jgi:protein ImuB
MTIPPRVLVVWCPDWPVVAAGVAPGEPAAVVHANRVVAASPAARDEGVAVGHRRREAQARCPELTIVAHDPARDTRAFEPVLQAMAGLTPLVELTEAGTGTFGTRGPSRYHGGDGALAARTAELVAGALGSRVDVAGPPGVGIADGRFAAALAAQAAVAGGRGQSGGGVVVAPGGSAGFLAPFPVTTLDDPTLVDLLPRLGLRTLGALAAVPIADVVARFGPPGRLAHRRASGLDDRPVDARPPPPDLAVHMELDPPVTDMGPVVFAGKHLADELHGRLAARGLACTRLLVVAKTEHGERHERLWRHDHAFTAAALTERVRWQLEGWALVGNQAPSGGITLLRLVPDEVVPDAGRQLGFWGGRTQADERAGRAAARLMGLLGPDAVAVPEWRGGRDPAAVVAAVPAGAVDLVDRENRVTPPATGAPWPGRLPAPSPATVLVERLPVEVLDGEGHPVVVSGRGLLSGDPARMAVAGAVRRVTAWAGPWPIDERWWDAATHRRRARFQLVTDDGAAHLAAVESGRWWVEARYD